MNGYGKTTPATVDDSNNSEVASGVHIASKQVVKSEEGGGILRSVSGPKNLRDILVESTLQHAQSIDLRNAESDAYSDAICNAGGSATIETNSSQDGQSGEYLYTYNNCSYSASGYSVTFNGTMYLEFNYETNYWLWEYNIDVTSSDSGSYSLNASYECTGSTDFSNCTVSENFSEGGVSYRTTNVTFTGTGSDYDFSARIYHEDYGYVDIEATGLVLCDDGGFSSGNIVVTDSSSTEVLSLTYSGCEDQVFVEYGASNYYVDQ